MKNILFKKKTFPYWVAAVWILSLSMAIFAAAAQAGLISTKLALWICTIGPVVSSYIHQQLPNDKQVVEDMPPSTMVVKEVKDEAPPKS